MRPQILQITNYTLPVVLSIYSILYLYALCTHPSFLNAYTVSAKPTSGGEGWSRDAINKARHVPGGESSFSYNSYCIDSLSPWICGLSSAPEMSSNRDRQKKKKENDRVWVPTVRTVLKSDHHTTISHNCRLSVVAHACKS